MALNRTKVLEAAQKFLQKGQHDKAIAEYQKLVKEDPRDVRTLLKIGDLHTRRGATGEAIHTYGKVAEQYASQGFFLKAVAVYKQILKLNPDQLDICEKLAAMYEELALVSDALKTYEAVSDGYARAGKTQKSLDTMQKMLELDPDNIAVHIKYAEGLSKAERADEAAEAFATGAGLLKEQGRMDDYIRVAERQLYHQPTNDPLAKELSGLYLERKDAKRALAKLQLCFKNDPRDIQTLEMLAEAFRQLGQGTKTISVLREIARIHGEVGAEEPRKRALSRILDLDPDDQEARQALGEQARGKSEKFGATMVDQRSPEQRAEDAAARDAEEQVDEVSVSDAELLVEAGEDDDILIVDEASRASRHPAPRSERPVETQEQRIARLLGEADMQASAGFWIEVEGLLDEVLELAPEHVGAREQLKDLYLQLGRDEDAVGQLLLLADACAETDVNRAIGYMQHAVRLAPDDPRPKLRLEALDAEASSRPPATEVAEAAGPDLTETAADRPPAKRPPAQEPVAAAVEEVDPLEQPISPDDFDSGPPPAPSSRPPASLDALLDAPIEDDFGAGASSAPPPPSQDSEPMAARGRPGGPNTLDALPRVSDVDDLLDGAMQREPQAIEIIQPQYDDALDAPIEDDFGAPPPARPRSSRPPTADALLDAPIEDDFGAPPPKPGAEVAPLSMLDAPIEDDFDRESPTVEPAARPEVDDFGLADPRFDESDVMQADMLADALRTGEPATTLAPGADEEMVSDEVTAESAIPGDVLARQAEQELAAQQAPAELGEPEDEDEDEVPLVLESEAPPAETVTVVPDAPDAVAAAEAEAMGSAGPTPVPAAPAAAPVAAEAEASPEIEETIDEAEFFFQQGMADDAIEAVQEALLIYPDHPLLLAKLAEFEQAADGQEVEEEPPANDSESPDESFKLAEQLAEQLGELPEEAPGEAIDVEQVFEQFKKGVAEQVSADDSATHFDLGIAYKEMGLVDDAMNEFRVASADPARECLSRTMIGMCLMEQGNATGAIDEFRAALACELKDERAELGLHYEIGTAHQLLGALPEALKEFEMVANRDPRFRDAQAKVDALRAQLPAQDDDADDLDRAFDDLMSEGD